MKSHKQTITSHRARIIVKTTCEDNGQPTSEITDIILEKLQAPDPSRTITLSIPELHKQLREYEANCPLPEITPDQLQAGLLRTIATHTGRDPAEVKSALDSVVDRLAKPTAPDIQAHRANHPPASQKLEPTPAEETHLHNLTYMGLTPTQVQSMGTAKFLDTIEEILSRLPTNTTEVAKYRLIQSLWYFREFHSTYNDGAFQAPATDDDDLSGNRKHHERAAASVKQIHGILNSNFAGLRITPTQGQELCNRIQAHATLPETQS